MGIASPLTLLRAFATLASLASAAQVKLGNTTLVGTDYPQSHQEFFGGIPFALPPVGARRFTPPVLLSTLEGNATYDAMNYGPSCVQIGLDESVMSEDCLTLNVFRPAGLEPNASLPVMVWIYGGAFQLGTTAQYNASLLVSRSINRDTPIIFVSANYRVGPFGFPQGPEAEAAGLLNVGLRDQLTALEWVQENIGAFGGDPQKVTVFGQSAGSMSIAHHYLNDISSVARGVIFESGWGPTLPLFNTSHWDFIWTSFAQSTPACNSSSSFGRKNTLECLQAGTTADLAAALTTPAGIPRLFIPVLDGPNGIIPDYPTARAVPEVGGRIPFISGTVLDDGTLFTPEQVSSTRDIATALLAVYSPNILQIPSLTRTINNLIGLYPDDPAQGSPFFTGNETFGLSPAYKRAAALVTDLTFFGLRRFFGQTAASMGTKVYSYWFTQPDPDSTNPRAGVRHSAELPYVFGASSLGSEGQVDEALSNTIMDYWISFAATLDPNDGKGSKRPVWEPYEATGGRVIQLNAANVSMVPDDFHQNQTDFLALESTHRAFSQ
ncbi:esterase 1 [Dentipellis sp. KUC8613]|nr:esterase 1 [Dentipellis sp. KUC8613]